MPQLHLYVPREVASELRRRAEAQGVSLSRYLAELVQAQVRSAWPREFFEGVFGRWSGTVPRLPPPGPETTAKESPEGAS